MQKLNIKRKAILYCIVKHSNAATWKFLYLHDVQLQKLNIAQSVRRFTLGILSEVTTQHTGI